MIRDYIKSDIEEIVKMYTLEYMAMPEEIETLKDAAKILVYEENGLKGFIHLALSGSFCYVEIGVSDNGLIKSVGLKLWKEASKYFEEKGVSFIQVFHVKGNPGWEELFKELGFQYWYSVYRFTYYGQKLEESKLCVRKYEDKYFEDKIRLESEAFAVLREENDIKPHNWYLSASEKAIKGVREVTESNKEYTYLFFEDEELVGASMVKNAEIDLLFVSLKHQGKGYGRRILEYTINRGLEQGKNCVNLNALASNEKALGLYRKAGFKEVQAQDSRRLVIK